jgi:hypothetical protein
MGVSNRKKTSLMESERHRGVHSIVQNARVRAVQYEKAVRERDMIHYFHEEE